MRSPLKKKLSLVALSTICQLILASSISQYSNVGRSLRTDALTAVIMFAIVFVSMAVVAIPIWSWLERKCWIRFEETEVVFIHFLYLLRPKTVKYNQITKLTELRSWIGDSLYGLTIALNKDHALLITSPFDVDQARTTIAEKVAATTPIAVRFRLDPAGLANSIGLLILALAGVVNLVLQDFLSRQEFVVAVCVNAGLFVTVILFLIGPKPRIRNLTS